MNGKGKNFRAFREGDVIKLSGMIHDDTSFTFLNEIIQDKNTFDMYGIISASWNGLVKFYDYLTSLNKTFKLRRVPLHVYKDLRLLPDSQKNLNIEDFEIELFTKDRKTPPKEKFTFVSMDAIKQVSQSEDAFPEIPQKGMLNGTISTFNPELFRTPISHSRKFQSQWAQQNLEQANFWYHYVAFLGATTRLAGKLLRSLERDIIRSLTNIERRIANAEISLNYLNIDITNKQSFALKKLIHNLETECQGFAAEINVLVIVLDKIQTQLQTDLLNPKLKTGDFIWNAIKKVAHLQSSLTQITSLIEDVGTSSITHIMELGTIDEISRAFDSLTIQSVNQETLDKIREIMMLVDPLNATSWEGTKSEVFEELSEIESLVNECLMQFQDFDLLRQVLEHRILEAEMVRDVIPELKDINISWETVRMMMVEQMRKRLLTDQEKYSFSFFLPGVDEGMEEEERISAGDVILF